MPYKDPADQKANNAAWHAKNKVRRAAADSRRVVPDGKSYSRKYVRKWRLKHKYGLTVEDVDRMLLEQGGTCAACPSDSPGHKRDWGVDHDHALKKGHPKFIRGILCHPCNLTLGTAKDNAERLRGLADYLKGNK